MRKVTLCLLMVLFACLIVGCSIKANYNLLYDKTEIYCIEIVKTSEADFEGIIGQTTVCVIDDIDAFINDLMKVDCYYHYTDPTGINENTTVIKVLYNSGEYELIDFGGQSIYTNENQYKHYAGYRYFDEEQFKNLITKYTSR